MHKCRNVSFVVLDLVLMKKRKKMEPLKPQMEGSKINYLFFAGTNVWYFCGMCPKTQNFVPAIISYSNYYYVYSIVDPVPFPRTNRKM